MQGKFKEGERVQARFYANGQPRKTNFWKRNVEECKIKLDSGEVWIWHTIQFIRARFSRGGLMDITINIQIKAPLPQRLFLSPSFFT